MPAMLDDPAAPTIYRETGEAPFPSAGHNSVPYSVFPIQVTLRDRMSIATLLPFSSAAQVPPRLLAHLADQLNREIDKGDTYPMTAPMTVEQFGAYWFQNFGAIMLSTPRRTVDDDLMVMEKQGEDWSKLCLGSFYIKPNYPGRSSHVCNGGFLVTDVARNKGVGRLMGECYLEWAPKLGYSYSVFNLVYETNVASCRIWDALGFKRIGRVKGCGSLRSYPDELIDAIIYGRELGTYVDDQASEERFDKIRFYLKHGQYPAGADRSEKSRLRSAATHYKLLPPLPDDESGIGEERLMLKDKEVVSDPQRQYRIAERVHADGHSGINKTTATIAEKYHWVRIKETVSLVIKNCHDCRETSAKLGPRISETQRRNHAANPQNPAATSSIAGVYNGDNSGIRPTGGPLLSISATPTGIGAKNGIKDDPNHDIERLINFNEQQNSTANATRLHRPNAAGTTFDVLDGSGPSTRTVSHHIGAAHAPSSTRQTPTMPSSPQSSLLGPQHHIHHAQGSSHHTHTADPSALAANLHDPTTYPAADDVGVDDDMPLDPQIINYAPVHSHVQAGSGAAHAHAHAHSLVPHHPVSVDEALGPLGMVGVMSDADADDGFGAAEDFGPRDGEGETVAVDVDDAAAARNQHHSHGHSHVVGGGGGGGGRGGGAGAGVGVGTIAGAGAGASGGSVVVREARMDDDADADADGDADMDPNPDDGGGELEHQLMEAALRRAGAGRMK